MRFFNFKNTYIKGLSLFFLGAFFTCTYSAYGKIEKKPDKESSHLADKVKSQAKLTTSKAKKRPIYHPKIKEHSISTSDESPRRNNNNYMNNYIMMMGNMGNPTMGNGMMGNGMMMGGG